MARSDYVICNMCDAKMAYAPEYSDTKAWCQPCHKKALEQARADGYQKGLMADKTVRESFQASVCYDEGYRAGVEETLKAAERIAP